MVAHTYNSRTWEELEASDTYIMSPCLKKKMKRKEHEKE